MRKQIIWVASAVLFFAAVVGAGDKVPGPVSGLVYALSDGDLQHLVNETLARNPKMAVATAEARVEGIRLALVTEVRVEKRSVPFNTLIRD